jgi:hypothetical protein
MRFTRTAGLTPILAEYGKEGKLNKGSDSHLRVTIAILWKEVRAGVTLNV